MKLGVTIRLPSGWAVRAALFMALIGWGMMPACTTPHGKLPGDGGAGTGGEGEGAGDLDSDIDYEGSTGSGDEDLNEDLEGEDDPYDPENPDCSADSIIDENGTCVPSCVESGLWCADVDPTECDGYPMVTTWDCPVCCEVDEDIPCPPGGCLDPEDEEDCPPGEDCSWTDTCPDAVCDVDGGEDCDSCPEDCGDCTPVCGDGECAEGLESCTDCPDDCACPATCGDEVCNLGEAPDGETCENCPSDCGRCVKVMTWDINAGLKKGKKKVKSTLKSIANQIKRERPDFVGLQSVDKLTKRSGEVDQALFIAKRAKMYKRFAGAFKFDGGQYGVAFLSKHKIPSATKVPLATSDEWAKRRVLLNASIELEDFYIFFHMGVTQLARAPKARLAQATTVNNDLGFQSESLLVGDFFDVPTSDPLDKLQSGTLMDLWPDYGTGKGLTSQKKRMDYVMAAFNWYDDSTPGRCAMVVRSYVKPAKGLASHRPVVALLQRGLGGGDCAIDGEGYDDSEPGGDESIGLGNAGCDTDADCAADPSWPFCIGGYCSECQSDADCKDPDYPTCTDSFCY